MYSQQCVTIEVFLMGCGSQEAFIILSANKEIVMTGGGCT